VRCIACAIPRLGRDVAIKVSAERFSERCEREARAVAALNHPQYLGSLSETILRLSMHAC
jgi:hypothetical protein